MNSDLMHDMKSAHKTQWAISEEIKGLVIGLRFGNYISGDGARGERSLRHCAPSRTAQMFWTFHAPLEPKADLP